MNNHLINVSIILTLLLFSITLLLSYSSNNDHRVALAQQKPPAISSSSNQSNRVLGAIASNLFANNPDAMVGGYHPPIYNASDSKPATQANSSFNNDHRSALALPAKEKGFLIADEKPFNISYSSSWIKNKGLPMQFTGVHSTPIISFLIPDFEAATSKSNFVGISKYVIGGNQTADASLSDYVKEEIKELESDGSFQLYESHPERLGHNRNIAHKIVYTTNIIDTSPNSGAQVIGHRKTMEIITVNNRGSIFLCI